MNATLAHPSAAVVDPTSRHGSDLLSQWFGQLEEQLAASDLGHLISGIGSFLDGGVNYNVQQTGNLGIDALLTGRKWSDNVITYSFYDGGPYYSNSQGLSEVSDVVKSDIRYILESLIEPLINLDFVEVSKEA